MLTLGDRLELEDERRFVGRSQELALLADVLAGRIDQRVIVIHGPGGIGKSTLLRQLRRDAAREGWAVRALDGREGLPTSGELEDLLHGIGGDVPLLLTLDTYERMSAIGSLLRTVLLPRLPAGSAVVVAQRGPPDAVWLQGGWERLTMFIELGPVTAGEARELLRREGIIEDTDAEPLLEWAAGSPLALTIGADALRGSGAWRPEQLEDNPELVELLIRRLTDGELDEGPLDVATVAAIARRTDARMLAGVLPGIQGEAAARWLHSCTFVEPLDGGLTLHDLVRTGLRAHVRRLHPERERELRRRIADHLYARAMGGETGLIPDLAELVENEKLRWALGGEAGNGPRADDARPDDVAWLIAAAGIAAERGAAEWLETTVRLVREAPSCALVARDSEERPCGICIWVTPATAPAAAERDPVLGLWLRHARAAHSDGNVMLWRDSLDLTEQHGKHSSRVLAIMNSAALVRSGLANPRYAYLPIDPRNPAAVEFSRSVGARRIEGLDVRFDEWRRECHLLDYGDGGLLAAHRATVYSELHIPLSAAPAGASAPAAHEAVTSPLLSAEAVKDALRNIDRPLELARSPVARGRTPRERAESVRRMIAEAAETAFGSEPDEQLLRELLLRRYLGAPTTHELVAEGLHVSRATYFRHLRVVFDRVADYVLALQS